MKIARLFVSTLLTLEFTSTVLVSASQVWPNATLAVEYTFNDASERLKNTGNGNWPRASFNGAHDSAFDGEGKDGTVAASFDGGDRLILIPSDDVDKKDVYNRMISFDFTWAGRTYDGDPTNPQFLYAQGTSRHGLNIFLRKYSQEGGKKYAQLVMAAWKKIGSKYKKMDIRTGLTGIKENRWYQVTLVLDADTKDGTSGTFAGYLDNQQFAKKAIDFLPIPADTRGFTYITAIGGVRSSTRTGSKTWTYDWSTPSRPVGFRGEIDNFRLRNPKPPTDTPAVVEYSFKESSPKENTVSGGSLDLKPTPKDDNGIEYDGIGASFTGEGCLKIPDSHDVNKRPVGDRTISLDFMWRGIFLDVKAPDRIVPPPQIIFEEGGASNGINIYLQPPAIQAQTAELMMAVWETNDSVLESAFIKTTIKAQTWYSASLVLDRAGSSKHGSLVGYLDDVRFEVQDIDFFKINRHDNDNCLGGMKEHTRIFSTDGSGASQGKGGRGLYFDGVIDNFKLFNAVERPDIPTVSPTNLPSASPTEVPTTTASPTKVPTALPTLSLTETPRISPTIASSTEAPMISPTSASPTEMPSILPTTVSPTEMPTVLPTIVSPTEMPSTVSPTSVPTLSPVKVLVASPTIVPSMPPVPTMVQEHVGDPTMSPSTMIPTNAPSQSLTPVATGLPTTVVPTSTPSLSFSPSLPPSGNPSLSNPTSQSSAMPSSSKPSNQPTLSTFMPTTTTTPSDEPSILPSMGPSHGPTSSSSSTMPSWSESPSELPTMPSMTTMGRWINLTSDDFESSTDSGWGNFESGGDYAKITTVANYVHQGMGAAEIRGGYGVASSFFHVNVQDVTGCSSLRVHFWYKPRSIEDNEGFLLEYSSNNGTDWIEVKSFMRGHDFFSSTLPYHEATVDFDSTNNTYALTDQAKLRFQCAGVGQRDLVYIDDIVFQCLENHN